MTRLTYTSGALDAEVDAAFDAALATARGETPPAFGHLIGGDRVAEGEVFERENPAFTDEVASRAQAADAAIVARAVAAARAATTDWRRMSYEDRNRLLRAAGAWMDARKIEIAGVVSLETGKTRVESIAEVQEGIDLIETYCAEMEDNDGFTRPLKSFADTERNTDTLRPYGVFGVIGPFNFPFALCIGMSAAALVAGNTVVLKPSEQAPWSGDLIAEAMHAAGLPSGVFNAVHGGADSGAALVEADVDGIAFTGSAAVGRAIAQRMQEGDFGRPALTEMGGKNPAIVTANADVAKAAEGVARAAFGLSGQKCSACSRAIVLDSVADEFVERLAEFTAGLALGEPGDGGAFLGPVIDERSVARFEEAAAAAAADGRVVSGGGRPDLPGHYVEPTVVVDLPRGHRLTRDELFLPFVTVTRVGSLDEAIEEANDIVYGLAAGVFTEDEREADEFFDRIEAGVTYLNRRAGATTGAWPGTQSFCGWKSSGTTGKGGLGPHYVPQFMREQSRTVVS